MQEAHFTATTSGVLANAPGVEGDEEVCFKYTYGEGVEKTKGTVSQLLNSTAHRAAAASAFGQFGRDEEEDFALFYEKQAVKAALSNTSIHICCIPVPPFDRTNSLSVVPFGLEYMRCMATMTVSEKMMHKIPVPD